MSIKKISRLKHKRWWEVKNILKIGNIQKKRAKGCLQLA